MDPWAEGHLFEYCYTHKTKKAEALKYFLRMADDLGYEGSDEEALYLEHLINAERNPKMKEALQELDKWLFRY